MRRRSETRVSASIVRVVVILLLWPFCSCSRQAAQTTAPPPANPRAQETAPQRIVTLSPNADDILCDIGAAGRIVGVSRFTMRGAELADRPQVGGLFDPDIERILSLRPDLIVVRGHNEEIERLCATQGIRLYLDPTEDIPGLDRCARDLANMLHAEEKAGEMLARFHGRLEAAGQLATSRRGDGRRPRVLLVLGRNPDALRDVMTSAKGTLHDDLIGIAGGENILGNLDIKYPTVSLEQIVTAGPDVIVELMPERHITHELREHVRAEWAAVGPLPAVRNDRVVLLGDEMPYSLVPSPRIADLVEKLVDILYPPAAP